MTESVSSSWDQAAEQTRLQSACDKLLSVALKHGAHHADVGGSVSQGLNVTVRQGNKETLEFEKDRSISLTVWVDGQKGNAATNDLSDDALQRCAQAAIAIAQHTQADPYSGLADAQLLAEKALDLGQYVEAAVEPDQAFELARRCEAAALSDPNIVNSEGGDFSARFAVRVGANSHGQRIALPSSYYSLSAVVLGVDGEGQQRDYAYDVSRDLALLDAPESIGLDARQRTLARCGSRKIQSGQYPVVFDPRVSGGLIGTLSQALNGNSIWRQSSWLLDAMDQPILPAGYDLFEEPQRHGSIHGASVDGDGLPTRAQSFIQDGRVCSWVLDMYASRRLKLLPTGNGGGTRNLALSGGQGSQADLLAAMGTGLLITEMMGQGVNAVTGDYSRGASGFWVENGQIQHPVEGITVACNLKELWPTLAQVGADADQRGRIMAPSLMFPRMTVAA